MIATAATTNEPILSPVPICTRKPASAPGLKVGSGNFIFPGCMRCHDGKHKGKGETSIPHDCHTCHIILEQGKSGPAEMPNLDRGLDFRHPVDIGSAWKETGCWECHGGVQP